MNPFKIFNTEEIEKINKSAGTLENRNYTKEELCMLENSILTDIMSKSSKNGDIGKARNELDSILSKVEKCKG